MHVMTPKKKIRRSKRRAVQSPPQTPSKPRPRKRAKEGKKADSADGEDLSNGCMEESSDEEGLSGKITERKLRSLGIEGLLPLGKLGKMASVIAAFQHCPFPLRNPEGNHEDEDPVTCTQFRTLGLYLSQEKSFSQDHPLVKLWEKLPILATPSHEAGIVMNILFKFVCGFPFPEFLYIDVFHRWTTQWLMPVLLFKKGLCPQLSMRCT